MLPPSGVMLQAIRDIVSQENLTKVGIIYDQTFGESLLNKNVHSVSHCSTKTYIRWVTAQPERTFGK